MASDSRPSRRRFLSVAGRGMVAAPVAFSALGLPAVDAEAKDQPRRLFRPIAPVVPRGSITLNVRSFGAQGNGVTKDTAAIQEAMDRCSILGGGRVRVPAGRYLTGALKLRSHVILHLEKGAVIAGSPDRNDYPVTQVRWEGKWIQGHIGLIYGMGAANVAVVGEGAVLGADTLGGRPKRGNPLRHPALIELIQCRHVQLEGFSTHYHHMWSIHPTYCESVLIRNLTIRSTGGNGDGIDVDSCRHVHIDRCDISTGDDCISLKSGRGSEGYDLHRPTENVLITDCTFSDSNFACIGIGSEMSGGIRDVRVEGCSCKHARSFALYLKSRIGRGGYFENIAVHDFEASRMDGGFLRINMLSSGLHDENPVPGLKGVPWARGLSFSHIKVSDCPVLVDARRIPERKPLEGFTFSHVSGRCQSGLYLANMRDVTLSDIDVTGYRGPLLRVHDVTGRGIRKAAKFAGPGRQPLMPVNQPPYKLH